jgi:Cu/Ag efflux protein CusF
MPKSMLIAVALVAGAVGLNQTMAQQTPKQGTAEEMKITGVVTKADEQTGEITIGDKTLVMEPGEGMYPRVGSKVTALYEDRNGKNVITRIGQAQQ